MLPSFDDIISDIMQTKPVYKQGLNGPTVVSDPIRDWQLVDFIVVKCKLKLDTRNYQT